MDIYSELYFIDNKNDIYPDWSLLDSFLGVENNYSHEFIFNHKSRLLSITYILDFIYGDRQNCIISIV